MDEYAFMLETPAHKLLSLAIEEYWKNEIQLSTHTGMKEAETFLTVVHTAGVIEFADYVCNKAHSSAIQLALTLINDPDVTDGRNIDDFPDSQWLSIQHQLQSDLVGWIGE